MSSLPRWNLGDLYTSPTDPNIEMAFSEAKSQAQQLIADYKGKLADVTAAQICDLLTRYETILQTNAKPPTYAGLLHAADSSDPVREGFQRQMRERAIAIERDLIWVDLELAKLSEERLKMLTEAPEMTHYRRVLEHILLHKPHQLSEIEEQLIADLQQTGRDAFYTLFEQEDSTKRFLLGDKIKTGTELLDILHATDRSERAAAADAFSKGLQEEELRRSFIYTTIIKNQQTIDRYRHFELPQSGRHLSNETTEAAVEAMAQTVEDFIPLFHRYYAWKAKTIGVEKLADYDRYAPLSDVERTYSYEEARDLVLRAFNQFSPVFAEQASLFFKKGWIDAEPAHGKHGGAFCSYGTADLHPYVLLNFQGKVDDVMTMAHELGHAIHASLARPKGYIQSSTPLTLAETASVFGEMLAFDALRKEITDPRDRQALLAKKVESIFATVFRQISLYRFEQKAHTLVRQNGFATPEQYHQLWADVHKPLFGEAIEMTPGYKTWWSYISHFFDRPFYVYAYAFGELLTCCLYEKSLEDPTAFREQYIQLLSNGGSKSPKELLSPLGLDPESTDTWKRGLTWIEALVDETIGME